MAEQQKVPVEFLVLLMLAALTFGAMGLMGWSAESAEPGVGALAYWRWTVAFFFVAFLITVIAVIGGAAGGVLFTPFMLAFTPVDSLIIRATGMILATFAGLISSGSLLRSGLANFRIALFGGAGYSMGAMAGALGAFWVHARMGLRGEALVRLSLGLILVFLILKILRGRGKSEWPEVRQADRFTRFLNARRPYYEPSLGRMVDFEITGAIPFFFAIVATGLMSGFFGMGSGWAIVSAQNLIMGVPLKVAAANSVSIFGMGGSLAVWPYAHGGAVIPLFVAPMLCGSLVGGTVAAMLLVRIQAAMVRYLLLALMIFSAYGLLARSLAMLGVIPALPWPVTVAVLVLTFAGCGGMMRRAWCTRIVPVAVGSAR